MKRILGAMLVTVLMAVHPLDAQSKTTTSATVIKALPVTTSQLLPDPALLEKLRSGSLGFTKILLTQRNPLNPTHVYTYHEESLQPGGGLWVCDLSGSEPKLTKIFDSADGEILDANLHYDGVTVLFSWKRIMQEPFQLFTIKLDGTELTQITKDDSNNFNACWLPDGGIAFLSDRKAAFAYCWQTTTPILYRCARDGSDLIRLSANYLNDFTPSVLSDGRIIYSRWEYVDRPAIPIQSLWAINPDGTNVTGVFGNRSLSPATLMDAREIPGRQGEILCVLTSHNGPCRGAIGIVNPMLSSNSQESISNLTPEINIGRVDKGNGNRVRGPYLNPFPVDDQYYLVSKKGSIELRDYQVTVSVPIITPSGLGFYCPQPIRPRKRERLVPSSLPKQPQQAGQAWATIMMQDVYNGLGKSVKRGEIKQIAVVQEVEKPLGVDPKKRAFGFQFPVVSCGATYAPKKIWGYATVEPDGSANFKVPAQEPIYFLPLDEAGRAVQRMRTFTHLMPGEVQGCIGCHSDRNSVTPKMDADSRRPIAMLREPQKLEKPEWGVHGFSYTQIIQPIWDQHCLECHDDEQPAAELELTGDKTDFFNVSYENLVRRGTSSEKWNQGGVRGDFKYSKYTSWIPTYNGQEENILEIKPGQWGAKASLLANTLINGHPDASRNKRTHLSTKELRRIFAWIDLNCPYYATSDSNHQEKTGCRRILPESLDATLAEVASRRCQTCHKDTKEIHPLTQGFYLRIDHPERNTFLRAPLAKKAGGSGACGKGVFTSTNDPDYQKLIRLFDSIQQSLIKRPRMDMMPLDEQAATSP
ncbi:MAG: hypothetical protein KJO21_02760 [Verrucomicrobiae bacterium]|nr:hypothetical protein [Verrucomicrobiae bacterium]NNJ41838.1 hypothetical protein [Akkermansiaceae bacterium]